MTARIELRELREDGGGRTMGYYAKGHHNRQTFAKIVEAEANEIAAAEEEWADAPEGVVRQRIRIPVSSVQHVWWRCVPSQEGDGSYLFIGAKPRSRGAFPATVTEHAPLAGWDGMSGATRGQSCWCPACGQPQRENARSHRLYHLKIALNVWRTARDWTDGWVLLDGDPLTQSFPAKYIHHKDVDNPYCAEQLRRHNVVVPAGVRDAVA